jgi:hypothetical protein
VDGPALNTYAQVVSTTLRAAADRMDDAWGFNDTKEEGGEDPTVQGAD